MLSNVDNSVVITVSATGAFDVTCPTNFPPRIHVLDVFGAKSNSYWVLYPPFAFAPVGVSKDQASTAIINELLSFKSASVNNDGIAIWSFGIHIRLTKPLCSCVAGSAGSPWILPLNRIPWKFILLITVFSITSELTPVSGGRTARMVASNSFCCITFHLLRFFFHAFRGNLFRTLSEAVTIRRLRSDKISRAALTDICKKVARTSALTI